MANATIILVASLSIDSMILLGTTKYSALDICNSFRGSLIPIVLCSLVLWAPFSFRQRDVMRWGAVVFVASILISVLQFATDTTVLPSRSLDGTFAISSPLFYGHIRAFSLFTSGLQAGLFYCIPAALGAALLLMRQKPLLGALLLSLGMFGSYATLTRLAMLGLAASVLSTIILLNSRLTRIAHILPLIWGIAAVLTIAMSSQYAKGSGRAGISSAESMDDRMVDWRFYEEKYVSSDLMQLLFGDGTSDWTPDELTRACFINGFGLKLNTYA